MFENKKSIESINQTTFKQSVSQTARKTTPTIVNHSFDVCHIKKNVRLISKGYRNKKKVCPIKHWQNGFPLTLVINYEQTFLSRSRKKFFFLLFHCVLGEQQKKPPLNLLTFLNLTTFEKLFNKAYILFIWMERRTSGTECEKLESNYF